MTLTELLVVVAVMAVLLGISVPTAQRLMDSFESSTGVRHLINAALSNARAIAVRQQTYAGVRFQQDKDGQTYMIFIVYDKEATGDADGFRAVTGRKPMKLPEDVGLISGAVANAADKNYELWGDAKWRNANTFSVIFSPAGKLTIHPVQCLRHSSVDTIFNIVSTVEGGAATFYQDSYGEPDTPNLGLDEEDSTQGFILYDKKNVKINTDTLWSEYFSKLNADFISPYTGELVLEYQE